MVEITGSKHVYVAWTNTDLTEGRGWQIPEVICETKATAIRLGHKRSVQGSDCHVTREIAVQVDGKWLAPAWIRTPSTEDKQEQKRRDKRAEVIGRAMDLGLTGDDIAILASRRDGR